MIMMLDIVVIDSERETCLPRKNAAQLITIAKSASTIKGIGSSMWEL